MKTIEILRTGTHVASSGQRVSFTIDDLKEIAQSYDPQRYQAPLIVTHNTLGLSDQDFAVSEFVYGWPDSLKVAGNRLIAHYGKISDSVVGWVRQKMLKSVSASVYLRDSPRNPKPGFLGLRHVSLLGKTPPAIKGLAPLNLSEFRPGFSADFGSAVEEGAIEFSFNYKESLNMDIEEINRRNAELDAREAKLRRSEFASFCESLKGRLTPAIASTEEVINFMEHLSGGDVEFAEGGDALTWFKGLLSKLPKSVEFGERVKDEIHKDDRAAVASPALTAARKAIEDAWRS